MNAWTVLGFVVGLTLGGLVGIVTMALMVAAKQNDEAFYGAQRDEFTGRLD